MSQSHSSGPAVVLLSGGLDSMVTAAIAREQGVWLRSFGRWLYTMPAYITSDEEMRQIITAMKAPFLSA